MRKESQNIADTYSPDSFQCIFWEQQHKATCLTSTKGMRWHPLMIRFCLHLQHKSNSAYEALRESGCIKLPSQRTLRDYTHYVKAQVGFSSEVDGMLIQAVNECEDKELAQYVLLLIDEMHVRENLVFDKHSGDLIGFTNLGDINQHMIEFEHALNEDSSPPVLANSMTVFMVRGLFNKLRFAHAQFPCMSISGDLLYDPFWEAVYRAERCGLKVCTI